MEQNKEQRQIELLKILAKGCKKHPAYRAIRKAAVRCEKCVVVWQARVELIALEKKTKDSIKSIKAYNDTFTSKDVESVQAYNDSFTSKSVDSVQAYNDVFTPENIPNKKSLTDIKNDSYHDSKESWFQFEWDHFFKNLMIAIFLPPMALFLFFSMQKDLRLDGNLAILLACMLYYFGFVSLGKDCFTASRISTGFC